MSRLSKEPTRRLLAVHGWSGTVLGVFLYLIVLTGAVAVFSHELGIWSAGGADIAAPYRPGFDAKMKELAASVDPEYLEEVQVFPNTHGQLVAFFHAHEKNEAGQIEDVGTRFTLDAATYEVIEQHTGFRSDMPSNEAGALEEFIVRLHVNLHAPNPWGLYATGILGFIMLYAAISGILLHKHLIKDIFVAPRLSSMLLNKRDRHILAGSWSLPFGFILAFTGAFFSFAGTVGLPVVAMVAFGGDQEKLIEVVIGNPAPEDETPMALANLDRVIAKSTLEAGTPPTFMNVNHWGRADAMIQLSHPAEEEALIGDNHIFNGATGEYQGIKPIIGKEPSVSGDVLSLIGPLHFGNFGGLLSKAVWFALGIAMCYVTVTGLQMWVKRREQERAWRWMHRALVVTTYGTPFALIGAGLAFFPAIGLQGDVHYWTAVGFLAVAALTIVLGFVAPTRGQLNNWLVYGVIIGMIVLPVIRMVFTGQDWLTMFNDGKLTVIGMDMAFWIGSAYLLFWKRTDADQVRASQDSGLQGAPAE